MSSLQTTTEKGFLPIVLERIRQHQTKIHQWLESCEGANELPLYSSVDIRDAGFKMAVVDTNIFPAGFNNLCEHGMADSIAIMRDAILKRVPKCKNILIIAEEHTRNTWYLENVRILQSIIEQAGFPAKIATFLTIQPSFCENANYIELETSLGQSVKIHCFKKILSEYQAGREHFDLIIMNNDLIGGIPEILKNSQVPIYPSIHAGWHSRLKSHHFCHTKELIDEFAHLIDVDPWIFSCLYSVVGDIDINIDDDRKRLMEMAGDLFHRIQRKYQKHNIIEKPYIVVKADYGTYGMGVMPIENPSDILQINRKNRNRLHKGKGAQVIERYLLQEGVPTIYNIDQQASEVCIYQIDNKLVGGFYRSHAFKTTRDNLNSQGMVFKKMCPHSKKYGDCGVHHDMNIFDVYRILARIAGIAAHREIIQLENRSKTVT